MALKIHERFAEHLQKTAADAKAQVETLTAQETEQSAEKSGLEEDLVKHKADLAAAQADLAKATAKDLPEPWPKP